MKHQLIHLCKICGTQEAEYFVTKTQYEEKMRIFEFNGWTCSVCKVRTGELPEIISVEDVKKEPYKALAIALAHIINTK